MAAVASDDDDEHHNGVDCCSSSLLLLRNCRRRIGSRTMLPGGQCTGNGDGEAGGEGEGEREGEGGRPASRMMTSPSASRMTCSLEFYSLPPAALDR